MVMFQELQSKIAEIGLAHHAEQIVENSLRNAQFISKTIRDIPADPRPCLVISAGPSLRREGILSRLKYSGAKPLIVCADGAYIQCLKAGVIPDWVVTIDPSPRIVRWFGEAYQDEYFKRQDLDIGIQEEAENRSLIDEHKVPLVICTTAPENVVRRTEDFTRYWFAPLVDDPKAEGSLTAGLSKATGCPALTTGGTVGTAGWAFAENILLCGRSIAVVGMDFGYYDGTPLAKTQEWNMLKDTPNVHDLYPYENGHWSAAFTSPTYHWYRQNFLDLLKANDMTVTNCSGGGLLYGENVTCMELEEWLRSSS